MTNTHFFAAQFIVYRLGTQRAWWWNLGRSKICLMCWRNTQFGEIVDWIKSADILFQISFG